MRVHLRPFPNGRNRRNGGKLLVDVLKSYIGVRLDVGRPSGPGPGRGPCNGVTAQRLERGTLGARGGITGSPVVVVDGVSASLQRLESVAREGSVACLNGARRCSEGA